MRLLLVGTPYDVHLRVFVFHLLSACPSIDVDLMCSVYRKDSLDPSIGVNHIFFKQRHFPSFFYKIPKIQNLLSAIDFRMSFRRSIKDKYSVVNVHYISIENSLCYYLYRRVSKTILLTPYGSDILRAPSYILASLRFLIQHSDFICYNGSYLSKKLEDYFRIPAEKRVNLSFGSDTIDSICQSSLTREYSKVLLGLEGKLTITVGYNASSAQNHIRVIDQLYKLPASVKENLVVLVPLTYPDDCVYKQLIKSKLDSYGLKYRCFESFMSIEEISVIRFASDIFINAQKTDASCASMKEYILTNNVVINASWLKYPLLCRNSKPFWEFQYYDELPDLVCKAIEILPSFEVSHDIKAMLHDEGWNHCIKAWVSFFMSKSDG